MLARELCSPVRSSLARLLGAWDKGDPGMALYVSAQLLAELTVLCRDPKFQGALEKVAGSVLEPAPAQAVKAAAPMCLWSVLTAMNEAMKG